MVDSTLVEVVVVKVHPCLRIEQPLLWLCEREPHHPRLLSIAIGQFEAAAIQMHLDRDPPRRPISYDLLSSMITTLDISVRYAVIHAIRDRIYYAQLVIERNGQNKPLDARPSDAVAVALRTNIPIYVTRDLIELAGYQALSDVEGAIEHFSNIDPQILTDSPEQVASNLRRSAPADKLGEKKNNKTEESSPSLPLSQQSYSSSNKIRWLQGRLAQAIIYEEYEEAAKLRDEIEVLIRNINRRAPN